MNKIFLVVGFVVGFGLVQLSHQAAANRDCTQIQSYVQDRENDWVKYGQSSVPPITAVRTHYKAFDGCYSQVLQGGQWEDLRKIMG